MRLRVFCTSSRCPHWTQSTRYDRRCSVHGTNVAALRTFAPRGPARSVTTHVQSQSRQTKTLALQCTTDNADPGHWEYSPEWWGTQAGGWGHDSGRTLFSHHSQCGNGEITVTAHGASSPPSSTELEQQWRVLRFNNTRQSVSRVLLSPEWLLPHADATCLAFEYLKTMASAAAAAIGVIGMTENALQPSAHATGNHQNVDRQLQMHARTMEPPLVTHRSPRSSRKGCRALCIGLGGGSLPNFLSHHFPGLLVDAVELDPLVVTAATDYMGFPSHRPNMQLHQGDAADYILKAVSEVHQGHADPVDMVFVDAFDANDDVPASLWSSDSAVLDALSKVLHPEHGTLVMNLHGGGMPAVNALVALFTSRLPFVSQSAPSGYHRNTEKGRAVQQITQNLREKLLGRDGQGCAFTLSVRHQSNIVVVVTRGMDADAVQHGRIDLKHAALRTGSAAGYLFECGSRSCRGLTLI
ncbi:hypothetical protein ABBQ38_005393 [Trebouxia sp. C0009 RCD-2024]